MSEEKKSLNIKINPKTIQSKKQFKRFKKNKQKLRNL
jgi:hypothetical protein